MNYDGAGAMSSVTISLNFSTGQNNEIVARLKARNGSIRSMHASDIILPHGAQIDEMSLAQDMDGELIDHLGKKIIHSSQTQELLS